jgi:hypothetical protein
MESVEERHGTQRTTQYAQENNEGMEVGDVVNV